MPNRVCAWCDREILDKRRKYYCGTDCHQAAQDHIYWDRRPFKAKQDDVHPRICLYCHNEFLTDRPASIKGRTRGLYCSRTCCARARQNNHHRICSVCGTRFLPPKVTGHRGRSRRSSCSDECRYKLNRPAHPYRDAAETGDYNALLELLKRDSVPRRISEYLDDECWVWSGTRDSNGYAQAGINKASLIRTIVELRYGAKLGSQAAHHNCGCGSDGCVRPSHLVPATRSANTAEMRTRTALEARVKELQMALSEYDSTHPLLQLIPVVWSQSLNAR